MEQEFTLPSKTSSQQSGTGGAEQSLSQTPRQFEINTTLSIDNTNKNFKGQQKTEVVHCFCRRHWIILLPHLIGFLIFLAALLYYLTVVSTASVGSILSPQAYKIIALVGVIGLTYYIHRFFLRFLNYYLQILIITNYRVIELNQTLYFSRHRNAIDVQEIQDIIISQDGVVPTLLNYGQITITLSSAHATKTFTCVPNPEYYFRKINKTKREYITHRRMEKSGVHTTSNSMLS